MSNFNGIIANREAQVLHLLERQFDPNVGGGVDRDKLPTTSFAGPERSFPIVTPEDVAHAARSLGRTKHDPEAIKRNIIRIARRKGPAFAARLPDAWKSKEDVDGWYGTDFDPSLSQSTEVGKGDRGDGGDAWIYKPVGDDPDLGPGDHVPWDDVPPDDDDALDDKNRMGVGADDDVPATVEGFDTDDVRQDTDAFRHLLFKLGYQELATTLERDNPLQTYMSEIANAPRGASALFDKIVKGIQDDPKSTVDNPYAVAWSHVKKHYKKDPSSGRWKKRKESEVHGVVPPREVHGGVPPADAYMEQLDMKETSAATSLAQLFRGRPVPDEWKAWSMMRRQRAQEALDLYEADQPLRMMTPQQRYNAHAQLAAIAQSHQDFIIRNAAKKVILQDVPKYGGKVKKTDEGYDVTLGDGRRILIPEGPLQ